MVLKGVWFLKYGYFVVFSFYVDNGKKKVGYVVVVMKFIMKLIIYCYCQKKKIGWWVGRKIKIVCNWKIDYYIEFFIYYGWGGCNNKWQLVSLWVLYVVYILK